MDEFYKPRLEGREVVLPRDVANMNAQDKIVALGLPAILGLTASPLIRARPQDLKYVHPCIHIPIIKTSYLSNIRIALLSITFVLLQEHQRFTRQSC